MDFFNSLSLDLKIVAVGIAGCTLLALFSSNPRAEKRYLVVLTVLAAVGVYRFAHVAPAEEEAARVATELNGPKAAIPVPKHTAITSTAAH